MNFLGFGPSPTIEIDYSGPERRTVSVRGDSPGQTETLPLFSGTETISGQVRVTPPPGKKLEHMGVKIELLGQIELFFERGNFYDFISLVRELEPPGELTTSKVHPFEFSRVEMQHESYNGINVRLRYVLRVTITRNYAANFVKDFKLWVRNLVDVPPQINNSIKMEVGIEDCLHIEFEYQKSKYHLKDVVVGKIFFLLVRIKIKHMEIEIRRKESTGTGANMCASELSHQKICLQVYTSRCSGEHTTFYQKAFSATVEALPYLVCLVFTKSTRACLRHKYSVRYWRGFRSANACT